MNSKKALVLIIVLLSLFITDSVVFAQDSLEVSKYFSIYDKWDNIPDITNYENHIYNVANGNELYFNSNYDFYPFTFYRKQILPGIANSIEAQNEFVYVTMTDSGFAIYENYHSNYLIPLLHMNNFGSCFDFCLKDSTGYLLSENLGLSFLDLSTPEECSIINSINPEGNESIVAINNHYLFLAYEDMDSIRVYDVDNPESPRHVNSYYMDGNIQFITINNNFAYVGIEESGLYIYNINDPLAPLTLISSREFHNVFNLSIEENIAYLATGERGIFLFDISDPTNIQMLGNYAGNIRKAIANNQRIFAVRNNSILDALNATQPDSIYMMRNYGDYQTKNLFYDSQSFWGHAIAASGSGGLKIVFLIEAPALLEADCINDIETNCATINDTLIAFCSTDSTVKLISKHFVYNEENRDILSSTDLPCLAENVLIEGDFLFLALGEHGMLVYDISDPAQPLLSTTVDIKNINNFKVYDNKLFVTEPDYGLSIFDFSDPNFEIPLISSLELPGTPNSIEIYDECAFVTHGATGFSMIDFYDLESPSIVYTIDTEGTASDICFGGYYGYVACGESGIEAYSFSQITEPQMVGYYDTPGYAHDVIAWHENCCVADENSIMLLRYSQATGKVENVTDLVPDDFQISKVYPNPFNPSTQITLNVPVSGKVDIVVFNLLGQKVAVLNEGPLNSGIHSFTFDGTDLSSGTYYVKAILNNDHTNIKAITLIK